MSSLIQLCIKIDVFIKIFPKFGWQKIGTTDTVLGIDYAFCKIFTSESFSVSTCFLELSGGADFKTALIFLPYPIKCMNIALAIC